MSCVRQPLSENCSNILKKIKQSQETNISPTLLTMDDTVKPVPASPVMKSSFRELDLALTSRRQTFISWPHSTPSRESMAANGWYCCNVEDRVLCLYCNTICQQWMSTDDPREVHARLAPECFFVRSMTSNENPSINGNESVHEHTQSTTTFSEA